MHSRSLSVLFLHSHPWLGHTVAAGLAAAAVVPQPGVAVLVRAALPAVGPRLGDVLADSHVPAHHHLSCYRGVSVRDGSEGPRSFHSARRRHLL